MYKTSWLPSYISVTLSVEFPQMQYADLSELIHVLKIVAIVTSEHLKLMDNFGKHVSHFLIAKFSP